MRTEASDKPIDSAVLSRMKQFRAMNKLKKLALKVCMIRYTSILIVQIICARPDKLENNRLSSLVRINICSFKFVFLRYYSSPVCVSNWNLDWLKVIAENLSEEEIHGLKEMFNNMDTDGSGSITLEELKTGLTRLGSKLTETEIKQLMDAVSTRKNISSCLNFP